MFWALDTPALPTRSTLVSLEPIGLGTAQVEGLASYVTRLAQAHAVHVSTLVREVIAPAFVAAYPDQARRKVTAASLIMINGLNDFNDRVSSVLANLTLQPGLDRLTLLAWRDLLANTQLLRETRAWCPACYTHWHTTQSPVYDPLIWSIALVQTCPYHDCPLLFRCPQCQSSQPIIPNAPILDHCRQCGHWLAAHPGVINRRAVSVDHPSGLPPPTLSQLIATRRNDWICDLFIYTAQQFQYPLPGQFGRILSRRIAQLGSQALAHLTHQIPTSNGTALKWMKGTAQPRLELFLRVCECLGVLPSQLLSESWPATYAAPDHFAQLPRSKLPAIQHDPVKVKFALETALAAPMPIAVRQVARELGCSPSYLNIRFSVLSHALSQRRRLLRHQLGQQKNQLRRDQIYQTVVLLHDQGIYPTAPRVCEYLGIKAMGNRTFPAWQSAMRDLNLRT